MERKIDFLGRITLPKALRDQLHFEENDIVSLDVSGDNLIISKVKKAPIDPRRTTTFIFDKERTDRIEARKEKYPQGTKVRNLAMESERYPIPTNMVGEVIRVDDIGSVHIKWANGIEAASLDIPGDVIEIISDKEYKKHIKEM